jgi:outer membrane protein OmpA-like peptidoglycan-associated protein
LLATSLFALPVGDPRTPDSKALAEANIHVEQGVHEISLHTFMGASKIDYPGLGGTKYSPGFGAAFSYSFFFTPRWGFLVGGGLQLFNNRGTFVEMKPYGLEFTDDHPDFGNDRVELYYELFGYSETQWSMMFMIPTMLQYMSNESRNKAFYYALGAKIGIPFAGNYEGRVDGARLCGYYPRFVGPSPPDYNFAACWADDTRNLKDPSVGFGEFGDAISNSRLKLSTAFFAAAELGVKWRLYNKLAVYTGFWLDWALNDVAIRSINDRPFKWTPILDSGDPLTPNADIEFYSRTTGKAVPVSMGFTVRFAFGATTHHPVPDSLRWIKEVFKRDSLLEIRDSVIEKMVLDSIRAANENEFSKAKIDALLDSLVHCRRACMIDMISRMEMDRKADSLARISEIERLAKIEAERQFALLKAREDSLARAAQLETEKEARLADFRRRLFTLESGLDNYSITQTVPSENARVRLDSAAVLMRDYPDLRLRIIGHTCDRGTYEANVRLGMQRAQSAINYLVMNKGISSDRLQAQSRAGLEPMVPNTNEQNRRQNRRIQIIVVEGATTGDTP